MVEKRWLAVFFVTCALGLAYTCMVLFLAFVRYQQNRHQVCSRGTLDVCSGVLDILKFDKKSTDL